jgi:hypothetical protein
VSLPVLLECSNFLFNAFDSSGAISVTERGTPRLAYGAPSGPRPFRAATVTERVLPTVAQAWADQQSPAVVEVAQ